jgi:hypothetical protein
MRTPESSEGQPPAHERGEPLFVLDHKPDGLELVIRAVCGALLGLLLATWIWVRLRVVDAPFSIACIYLAAVGGSAYFAAKYGDRFWYGLASFFGRRS